jgi:hypothetical protein
MARFQNMEVVLMLLFGVLCTAACLIEPSARPRAVPSVAATQGVEMQEPMAIVVITGKRLTPAQKRAEIAAEAGRAG